MNKEELKGAIMHQFEQQNLKTNEVIPMNFWNHSFLRTLNPREEDLFIECVNELQDEGKLIYESEGIGCLRLTQSGMDDLYINSKSVQDIEEDIMGMFRSGKYRVGHGFMLRNLGSYIRSLSPVEKPLIEDAIENLINKHYIRLSDERDFLFLEEAGYNYIY